MAWSKSSTGQEKARLNRFEVIGARQFSDKEIQNWFALKKGDYISSDDLKNRGLVALTRLHEAGAYFAKFDSLRLDFNPDSTLVNVVVQLSDAEFLEVGEVRVTGALDSAQEVIERLHTRRGATFYEQQLREDVASIIKFYEGRGYPYCKVTVRKLKRSRNSDSNKTVIDVEMEVVPGPRTELGSIEILGNTITKDYVVLRELGLRMGSLYDHRLVEQIPAKLMKLGYFNWVNEPRLEWRESGTGKLIIELAEASQNRFDGVVGYNPPSGNTPGFVTGLIDLSFGNLFGTGRLAKVFWQRRTAKTQELKLAYREPWILGKPLHLGVRFSQIIQDTTYIDRTIGFDGEFHISRPLSLFAGVARRSVSPDSVGVVLFNIPRSNSLNARLGLTFDTVDYAPNPSAGVLYKTSFEWRRKTEEPSRFAVNGDPATEGQFGTFDQRVLELDFETYLPLFRWQVLAIAVHGREISSDERAIGISDEFRLGGTRDLRGYREEQFRGSRVAWLNLEYRYLLNRESRFFAFLDTGYFLRGRGENTIDGAKLGYGVGVRIDTRLGFFGIDYGLGQGDGLSNGKVHVSLTNAF